MLFDLLIIVNKLLKVLLKPWRRARHEFGFLVGLPDSLIPVKALLRAFGVFIVINKRILLQAGYAVRDLPTRGPHSQGTTPFLIHQGEPWLAFALGGYYRWANAWTNSRGDNWWFFYLYLWALSIITESWCKFSKAWSSLRHFENAIPTLLWMLEFIRRKLCYFCFEVAFDLYFSVSKWWPFDLLNYWRIGRLQKRILIITACISLLRVHWAQRPI